MSRQEHISSGAAASLLMGIERLVPMNVFCDCLISLLAGMLVMSALETKIERLCELFRDKLTVAVGQNPVRHA